MCGFIHLTVFFLSATGSGKSCFYDFNAPLKNIISGEYPEVIWAKDSYLILNWNIPTPAKGLSSLSGSQAERSEEKIGSTKLSKAFFVDSVIV